MRFGCRPGTWDQAILGNVLNGEYGAIDFSGKVVLDIGAHIGAFSLLAAHCGARRVVACEAASENFALLRANCAPYSCVECIQGAVWSSADPHLSLRWRRNAHPENTGGGTVLACEAIAGFRISDAQGEDVVRIAFDDLVRDLGRVDLVKIDAEGSEYPILLGSAMLGRVGEIVGEYHALSGLQGTRAIRRATGTSTASAMSCKRMVSASNAAPPRPAASSAPDARPARHDPRRAGRERFSDRSW